MTKAQLIAELADVPDDALVVLSRDSEGNGYSPLCNVGMCRYAAETTWRGEIDHPDEPFDPPTLGVVAVALWPVS